MSELKIDPEIPNLKEEVKRVLAEKVEMDNFDLCIRLEHQRFFSNQLCSQIEEILHELESSSEPDDDSDEEGSRRRRRSMSKQQCERCELPESSTHPPQSESKNLTHLLCAVSSSIPHTSNNVRASGRSH